MKVKRITAFLTALTLTVALSACGKRNIELAQSGTESKTESKVLKETETEILTEEVTQETTEEVTKIETEEVAEEITEKVTEEVTEKATNQQVVQTKTNSEPATTQHTHSWKEHTATTQVWVPNMVTVDDYEEQVRESYYFIDGCGARFEADEEDALNEHIKTNMLKAVEDARQNGIKYDGNWAYTDCLCGRFLIYPEYITETVKVGSHEEDHGHYEDSTYVDYYYCDCGATK